MRIIDSPLTSPPRIARRLKRKTVILSESEGEGGPSVQPSRRQSTQASRRPSIIVTSGSDDEYPPPSAKRQKTGPLQPSLFPSLGPLQPPSSLRPFRGGAKSKSRPSHAASSSALTPTNRQTRASARRNSSASLTTDLESIAAEDRAVKREIARLGLALRDVKGDGNCLYRAIADQLWGQEKRHPEVRKLVCDHLETNRGVMEPFLGAYMREGEGYEGYVKRMRQPKTFGSHIEIQSAARVFKRNIRVVMPTSSFTIPWQTESFACPSPAPEQPPDCPSRPRLRTRSGTTGLLSTPAAPPPSSPSYAIALAEYIPPIRPGRSMLWLALFSQAEHFQSVRRKGDGDSGAAEVEDKLAIPHEMDTSEAARRERGEVIKGDRADRQDSQADLVSRVLASLPPDHHVSPQHAKGILARVKGDLGEAVEILLEEMDFDRDSTPGSEMSADSPQTVDLARLSKPTYREPTSPDRSPPSSPANSDSTRSGESGTSGSSKITTPSERSSGSRQSQTLADKEDAMRDRGDAEEEQEIVVLAPEDSTAARERKMGSKVGTRHLSGVRGQTGQRLPPRVRA